MKKLRGVATRIRLGLFLLAATCLSGCFDPDRPQTLSLRDPQLAPYLEAAARADFVALGFQPLPTSGEVRLEVARKPGGAYDAMIHFDRGEMAFRKTAAGYLWIHQQETHRGPRIIQTPDGPVHEGLFLIYQTERITGVATNKMVIIYDGDDPRLAKKEDLTVEEVRPILREWSRVEQPNW